MAVGEIKILRVVEGVDITVEDGFVLVSNYGDPDTDGSFRVILDSGELKTQKTLASVWTTLASVSDQ